jgi:hypothetical protein
MMRTLPTSLSECELVRADLALYSGGDLADPAAVAKVRGHLVGCAACQATLARLTESLDALQACAAAVAPAPGPSLWPALARRLPFRVPSSAAAQFNVWVPTAAMTAACAAMVLVTFVQLDRAGTLHAPSAVHGQRNLFDDQTFVDLQNPRFQRDSGPGTPVDFPVPPSQRPRTAGPLSPERDW